MTEEKLQSVYTRCQSKQKVPSKMLRMKCMLVKIVKHYMVADLGPRRFGGGGKRVIVFLGFSKNNKHYKYALKMKEEGYWDEVKLVGCRDS